MDIASANGDAVQQAIAMIQALTREAEVGKIYLGTVRKIAEFGAFVELFPGTDGLIHISELSDKRVKSVSDVLKEGDEVMVKVVSIDKTGKIRLSRKEALASAPLRRVACAASGRWPRSQGVARLRCVRRGASFGAPRLLVRLESGIGIGIVQGHRRGRARAHLRFRRPAFLRFLCTTGAAIAMSKALVIPLRSGGVLGRPGSQCRQDSNCGVWHCPTSCDACSAPVRSFDEAAAECPCLRTPSAPWCRPATCGFPDCASVPQSPPARRRRVPMTDC